jgi:hypothetical protein
MSSSYPPALSSSMITLNSHSLFISMFEEVGTILNVLSLIVEFK